MENVTINVYGDKLIFQCNELVIERSLSQMAENLFSPQEKRIPTYIFKERDVKKMLEHLEDSNNLCPERQIKVQIENYGLCDSMRILKETGEILQLSNLCADCNCL